VIAARRLGRTRPALVATVLASSFFPCQSAVAQGRAQAATVSRGVSQTPGWSLHLSTQGAYESNPNFLAPPSDPSDFSGSVGGGLAYSHLGPKGSFSFSGDGGGLYYRELTDLNTYTYGGTMSAAYRPGSKTQMTFNGSVMYDYTRRSNLLLDQGIVLPQSQVLTMRFDAGLSHTFTTRTTLSASGRFERAQFEEEGLNDGDTLGATATLGHRVNQRVALSASYAHDQSRSEVQTRSIDTAYGSVRLVLNPRTDIEANLGVSSVSGGITGRTYEPYGGARIDVKHPKTLMTLAYGHQVRQDYGVGRITESDLGSFNLTRIFGRRKASFNTSLTYALNRSQTGLPQVLRDRTAGATAGFQIPFARKMRADSGYSYFRSSLQDVDSHTVFVAFSYRMELH
jgi:hypothetical protein